MTQTAKPIMNPALREFWEKPSRFKVLYGGRGSSKSWDAATNSVRISNSVQVRILCTRMFQNKIEESVYTTIKKQIDRFGLGHRFRILNNKIINRETGSEFLFYGLARNVSEIKSLEGVDILWIEEAHSLTEEMWEDLEPTIRNEHSEIWIIFNPKLATDFAYKKFVVNPPKNAIIRKINYNENPFISNTLTETINELKERDYESYLHIYEGIARQDDEEVIIKRSWLNSCIDAHLKLNIEPTGERITGYDVADDGADLNAYVNKHGILIHKVEQWKAKEDELFKSSKRIRNEAIKVNSTVRYDSVGVGAGVGSNIKELNEIDHKAVKYEAFHSGGAVLNQEEDYEEGVTNKDYFTNVKAQLWKLVADRVLLTHNAVTKGLPFDDSMIISISSDCDHLEQLLTELSTPRKDYDGSGKFMVEQKKKMRKRGVKSPNLADAFIMCFAPKETYHSPQVININI